MDFVAEDLLKLILAVVVGSLIGAEREYRDKSAGFRTLVLICTGSTMFTMLSLKIANNSDPARIAAQIVTGVGFLGAGAILRDGVKVAGLTTAAMIWLMAALGMGIGSGNYVLSGVGAILVLIVMWVFPRLELRIDGMSGTELYEIVCENTPGHYEALLNHVKTTGLKILSSKCNKANENIIISLLLQGSPESQAALAADLLNDPTIKEFRH